MLDRRLFLFGIASTILGPDAVLAHNSTYKLSPKYEPTRIPYRRYPQGTVVVDTGSRFLYFVEGGGYATRYGVGVGRAGLSLKGRAVVGRKAKWPSWTPTASMIKRSPGQYARYAKGVPGGPDNPLGARALYLYRNGQDTMYRIHGTNDPSSIGKAVSNGCIRMLNAHVERLYDRIAIGATVVVL
ncbi:L,D-transpeptidase [Hyphomonas sp.]|uniref:L,D-transpeptidase n=1 Tax=Alphaproteobacteria TaxID=28211 RepID=UPI0032663C88